MSRTYPTELAFDETLIQPDRVLAPYVTNREAEAYASYTVTLHTSGQRWLRHELGYCAVSPRKVELEYARVNDGPWRIGAVTVTGPTRMEGPGVLVDEWLSVQFTWSIPTNDWTGAAGTTCSADEALPSWLRDEVEAYRPKSERVADLVGGAR